jgi:hypothetical protein
MLTCKLQGGLGNQLFQIFTTMSYALKYNKPFFFLYNHQLGNGENGSTIRYTYWESFLSNLKPFLKNIDQIPQLMFVKEKCFIYEDISEYFSTNSGIMLVGYFQSPLYFEKYKNMICKLIKLDQKKIVVKNKVKIDVDNVTTISLHFRLGDYKNLSDFHPILSEKYYSNSISIILDKLSSNKQTEIIYFCEDQDVEDVDKTIKNLKQLFPSLKFNRANPILEDWEQMLLMSLCNHNIIANSTFSWWAAYLNNNLEKIVCYPEDWFGPKAEHDTSDLFPNDWFEIGSK